MKNEIFFQYLNLNKSHIQSLATELSNDFAIARFLYQETTHQAMKNKANLKEETFKDWLRATMKKTYHKIIQNEYQIKN
jgi:DNA-directed RNA polymerase specialized sigma24 family protein